MRTVCLLSSLMFQPVMAVSHENSTKKVQPTSSVHDSLALVKPVPYLAPRTDDGTSQARDKSQHESLRLVGIIDVGGKRHALLHSELSRDVQLVPEGTNFFGYQVTKIAGSSVVISRNDTQAILQLGFPAASRNSSLSLGRPADGPKNGEPSTIIPDLVRMDEGERQRWFMDWRAHLSRSPITQQAISRSVLRDYWRKQWMGSWGDQVRVTKSLPEQERIRRELSNYWRL